MSARTQGLGWLALSALSLVCCAAPQPVAAQPLRAATAAYELEVLVNGVPARTFEYGGESFVLGQEGRRYVLRVHNRSSRRIEAVVSVDGLDAVDGKAGDYKHKRGYLVDAYGHVDIDGWRLSNREAAAFRFAPIGESYAAKSGSARNVGVIGLAVFPERVVPRPPPVYVPRPEYDAPSSTGPSMDGLLGDSFDMEASPRAQRAPAASAAEAAPAPAKSGRADDRARAGNSRRERSGLGTEFGEAVSSEIRQVSFVRANAQHPAVLLGVRYNDRTGLIALGVDVDGTAESCDLALRQSANPFPAQPQYARPPADWRRD
jgi:hypothetical protein